MKSNHIKYIHNMKHSKNGFILYSLSDKKSNVSLQNELSLAVLSKKSVYLDKIIFFYKILCSSMYYLLELNKSFNSIQNSLCVVYGIHLSISKITIPNWYIYKIYSVFINQRFYLIQITDPLFIIQNIFKDVKQILIGFTLIIIDFINLSKLRNYLYEYVIFFVKWILLIFQTFILQIDEDGEETLNKIKETDVFRRQRPGVTPFLKDNLNYDEDFTFLTLRNLKRKNYLFFRILSLSILPLIIYQTNQKFHLQPSLPKLAYVIDNFNKNIPLNPSSSQTFSNISLFTKFGINLKNEFKYTRSLQKKNSFYNTNRIISLWHASKFQSDKKIMVLNEDANDQYKKLSLDLILGLKSEKIFNRQYKNEKNIYLSKMKELNLYLNENELSNIIYNNVLYLIKPKEISYFHLLYFNVKNHILMVKKNIFFNKIPDLIDKYFNFEHFFSKYISTKEKYHYLVFNKLLGRYQLADLIESLFYNKKWVKKNAQNINKSEILIGKKAKFEYQKQTFSTNDLYQDQEGIFLFVEKVLQEILLKTKENYLNLFENYLNFSERKTDYINNKYHYTNSFIHLHKTICFLKEESKFKNNFENKSLPILIWNDLDNYSTNQSLYSKKNINQLFFLDSLHSLWMEKSEFSFFDKIYKNLFETQPIWHIIFFDQFSIFSKFNLLNLKFKNDVNIFSLKEKIYKIIYFEINQINIFSNVLIKRIYCDQYLKYKTVFFIKEIELIPMNSSYIRDVLEISNKTDFIRNFNQSSYYTRLTSLYHLNLWESIAKLFQKETKLEHTLVNIDIINNQNITEYSKYGKFFSMNDLELLSNSYIRNQVQVVKNYLTSLFTSEWWLLVGTSIKKFTLINWQDMLDNIVISDKIITLTSLEKINDDFQESFDYIKIPNLNFFLDLKFKFSHFLFKQKMREFISNLPSSLWQDINIFPTRLTLLNYWQLILSFTSTYCFSIIIGGSSFVLWILFERVRYLTHLSWNTELDLMILRNLQNNKNLFLNSFSIKKKKNLQEQYNLSKNQWSISLRILFSNLIGYKLQNIWLYNTNTSDIYKDQRHLTYQIIVGEESRSQLTLSSLDQNLSLNNGYSFFKQEGLDYLKQLTSHHYKWYNDKNCNLIHNQRFISFAFYKAHSASLNLWQLKYSKLTKQKYTPISVQLTDLYSKAILLIGKKDTGKSYLIKSLAADTNLPLIYIALDKLIDVLEFEDTTLEDDSSLYFLRENILKFKTISTFIKKIQSSIIWIPNIENINFFSKNTSKTREYCTFLILRFLLKNITEILSFQGNTIFIGSSEDTSYLDPGFISIKRFSRFINLRIPNNLRRAQIFANLLKKNKLSINRENNWYIEFSNSTMGFNLRDLTSLANQAFLVSLEKKKKNLNLHDIRLVLYRESRANHNKKVTNFFESQGSLSYKIGRAIIQTILVRPNPKIPLQTKYDLWKPRFYYLSKAYLQPDYLESTITQLNIFPHILSCLAGSASRDADLFVKKKNFSEVFFSLDKELTHDLDLAVNLFESIFKEFPCLDIYGQYDSFMPKFQRVPYLVNIDQGNNIQKKYIDKSELNFIDSTNNNIADEYLENISFDITWSSKIERLTLSRSILFDLFKRVDENLSLFSSLRYLGNVIHTDMLFEITNSYASIYHRSWDVMKSQIPKDLDYNFYAMLSKKRITNMGLPIISNQLIEYESPESDLLFFSGRLIWNPAATFLRNLVFCNRHLFANEELLSLLYLVYQSQRTLSLFHKKSRRKGIWNPDAYLEKLTMNSETQESGNKNQLIKLNQYFSIFKDLSHANAIFQRPQAEIPNNSEMSFIKRFISYNRFSKSSLVEDIFYKKNQFKKSYLKIQEILTYGSILEIYFYLFKFFIKNKCLVEELTTNLLKKQILFEEDLQKKIFANSEQ